MATPLTRIENHAMPPRLLEPTAIVSPAPQSRLEQLEGILDSLSEFVCRVDLDGVYTYVNAAYLRLIRRSRDEVLGQPMLPLIRDAVVRDLLADLLANPRPMKHRHVYEWPDGTKQYEEWTEQPIYDSNGAMIGIQSVGRDITDEVMAEEARQQAETNYRLLARNLPDTAVFVYDHDLIFRLTEGPLLTRAGFTRDMLEDKHVTEVAPDYVVEAAIANFKAALAGERRSFESSFLDMELLASVAPIQDEWNEVVGGLILVQDVTERKRVEREALRSALEHETATLLAGFIRDTSHDLRTPLSVIVTNTYLLRRHLVESSQIKRLEVIDSQVKRLERLINELHMMSSLDAIQRSDLALQPLDLNQLILNVTFTNAILLREKNQTLQLELEPEPPPMIEGDESQWQLVMLNLIENAHLYSPPDSQIIVRTKRADEQVIIQVVDHGEGIASAHLPLIFDRFYKVDSARSTNRGGAGLGLAIVRKIVTLHGGTVSVESAPGNGSTFTVTMPLRPSS
jgi:PAS domain S-box-containing protein